MTEVLIEIQRRQHTDRSGAEQLLRDFIQDTFPLNVSAVELRPLAVSLNSFNGFLTLADGHRLFFKTHTEPHAVISEFYNSALLAKVGYPTLEPVHSSVTAGRQLLIYEVVDEPSVFDIAWQIEIDSAPVGSLGALTEAQIRSDRQLFEIYVRSLEWQDPDSAAVAPVHQLFHHRLAGTRFRSYYGSGQMLSLPGAKLPIAEVFRKSWSVNGQRYKCSLGSLIADADRLLQPSRPGASVIGHGDAHNGNIFFVEHERQLVYFDPAFGGRHDPFLDLAKPIFHNTFAMWMYYPELKNADLTLTLDITDEAIVVTHDFELPPIRHMFLHSKLQHTLTPILTELRGRGWLPKDWRARFKAALFCCPLLTKNLADGSAFPPEIRALGFAMAVEMGAESGARRSLIDRCLDDIERQVA
ncbi:hypothetical protein ACTMTJ_01990 [Phytohabitans sp. LJ34]|uniref:hypothetical protein n=1 Tax=Phytohabitans sp. LJ34 TaxID=3452217 RepID=UPI003F8A3410